ncbi:hypothetical protein [Sulfitobacter sp.]|uniref:hypothetical protein n=1 Tax=Sulfitobacter sp. TaxID=1903071 RepID=UPI00300377C6
MAFKITIEEIGQEVRTIGAKWELGAGETPSGYGYTPEIETTADFERKIYEQTVDELDMPSLVSVVNKIAK